MKALVDRVKQWHYDRNLIDGSTDKDQFHKLLEEVMELQKSLTTGRPIHDDIGDIMVVLINLAERNKTSLEECLTVAYHDIKDRKGQMIDGIFVKEQDL